MKAFDNLYAACDGATKSSHVCTTDGCPGAQAVATRFATRHYLSAVEPGEV
jgi:hypothetical protein